jgi:Tfp pilus assembly protein PilX
MKKLIRGERGQAMVLALIMLLVSLLIATPLLSYMGTGLMSAQVYERRVAELYAADAGVEDAMWNIQHEVDEVMNLNACYPDWSYNMSDVNGKNMEVTITWVNNMTYRVVSTATGDDSGTEIEAYVVAESKYGDYTGILNNVLTSQGEIEIGPGSNITPSEGEHSPVEYYPGGWPPEEELVEFYLEQVEGVEPYVLDTLDLDGVDDSRGPFYRDGELEIVNTENTPATLTLTGTVFITGDTEIGVTGKDFTLDLNNQTIFVASNTSDPHKALEIGGKCSIEGFGIIIAIGDIYFAPNIEAGQTDPIFIMSVEGTTNLQPGGDFYGSIAGSVEVDLQPGTSLNYPEGDEWFGDLNFLIGVQQLIYSLSSWEVNPL